MPSGNTAQENSKLVPIAVALIGAAAAVIVGYWQYSKPKDENLEFVGRVRDAATEVDIRSAKITLEAQGSPPVMYTDSAGTFSFVIKSSDNAIRIRVEADGYEKFDRLINPSAKSGTIEEIRLTSIKSSSPNEAKSITGIWEQYVFGTNGVQQYIGKVRVAKQNDIYVVAGIDSVNGVIPAILISDFTYNGDLITFKSTLSDGKIAYFRLRRISDTIFEGETTVNGQLTSRTRVVKIE